MNNMRIPTTTAFLTLLCGSIALADTPSFSIPFVQGIEVEKGIEQWKPVAPIGDWNQKDRIVYGANNWTGPADLGGTAWMGWDEHNLYVAADITDDQVRQTGTGENLWRGDHVMVLMNVHPEAKLPPGRFQQSGQFMLGLNPGSLSTGGDLLASLPPEVYIWQPQYVSNSGIAITATRTKTGYAIQAAIPWEFLGVRPHDGLKIDFDLCPSDCDTQEMQQQTLASLKPGKWEVSTARLLSGELKGGPKGATSAAAGAKVELSQKEVELQHGQTRNFTFTPPANTEGLVPVVSLKARLASKRLGGASYGLVVQVNGKPLEPERCINRPASVVFASGTTLSLFKANSWTLIYSPDYKAIHTDTKSSYYIAPGEFDAYDFRFNVQGLLKQGQNTVTVRDSSHPSQKIPIAFEDLAIQWVPANQAKKPEEVIKAKPPVTVRPPKDLAPPAQARLSDGGAIHFQAAGKTWTVESQFSSPDGKWLKMADTRQEGWTTFNRASGNHLSAATDRIALDRTIRVLDQCIEIHEKLTNKTDQNQPVMIRHQLAWPVDQLAALTLNGRPMPLNRGITSDAANPTLLLKSTQGEGVALIPYDGVFRLHHQAFYLNGTAGLADSNLVLAPHATYEQVWQVYTIPSGDYWDLVNAVRKQWDTNFKLEGPFAFVDPRVVKGRDLQGDYTVEQMRTWLAKRNVGVPVVSDYDPITGAALQGLANKLEGKYLEKITHFIEVIRQADPKLPILRYYHCFITGTPFDKEADPADALLDASGHQVFYSNNKHWPIFVPTTTNQYGRQMTQLAKDLVQKLKLNGIYWDEQQTSAVLYHYGKPWDGVSGDIDRKTHKLIRTKSLVPLISAEFRYNLLDWMAQNNMVVLCNGQPYTPEDAKYKMHRFVETGSVTNLYDASLFSPCGLGDHLTERTGADVIRSQIRFLDYGCLYDYYSSQIDVKNPGLCRWMYPITPVALGPGYILGREKILTNRPGRYSWGDKTLPPVEVHVIDPTGQEIKADWKKVSADGIEWVQLTLPPGHAAAIVRK